MKIIWNASWAGITAEPGVWSNNNRCWSNSWGGSPFGGFLWIMSTISKSWGLYQVASGTNPSGRSQSWSKSRVLSKTISYQAYRWIN